MFPFTDEETEVQKDKVHTSGREKRAKIPV